MPYFSFGLPTRASLIDLILDAVISYSIFHFTRSLENFLISRYPRILQKFPISRFTRLRRNLQPADSRQLRSLFMHLPRDVVLCIADHLPPESVAALALTCRALWLESSWKRVIKDPGTRLGLLPLLVHDQPGIFYCYNSRKLHRINEKMRPGDARYWYDWACCSTCIYGKKWRLYFFHAHLVMNAHRYGLSHGLPVDGLRSSRKSRLGPHLVERSREARIISNELFICDSLCIREPQLRENDVRLLLDRISSYERICRHEFFDDPWSITMMRNGTLIFPKNTRSCQLCLSEGEVDVKRDRGQRGWVITARSYHQLGRCEVPYDWKWASWDKYHLSGPGPSTVSVKKQWISGRIDDMDPRAG